jgi:galactoside O-acetyltransferase
MRTSFLSDIELKEIGFKSYGKNILISKRAAFYSPEKMVLGDHVRIDDFCILSGKITIGNYVHISAYTALYGKYGIELKDYSGLSPRVIIFSASDDFSGEYAVGPLLPQGITNVYGGKVIIDKYVQVGSGSIIFPDIHIHEGAAIGAMSLINDSIPAWKITAGVPAKIIKDRKKELINKISTIL